MRHLFLLALILSLPWVAPAVFQQLGIQVDFAKHVVDLRDKPKWDDGWPSDWNEDGYLAANPDVAAAVRANTMPSGYHHYQLFGRNEGRGGWPTATAEAPSPPVTAAPLPAPELAGAAPVPAPPSVEAVAVPSTSESEPPGIGEPADPPRAPFPPQKPTPDRRAVAQERLPSPPPAEANAKAVTAVRIGQHPDLVRIVLDVTMPTAVRANVTGGGRSIVVDLSGVQWKAAQEWRASGPSVVESYRVVSRPPSGRQLELRARDSVALKRIMNFPPEGARGHRIVLDFATLAATTRAPTATGRN